MKKILINIYIGILFLCIGVVAAKQIVDILKMIPLEFWICLAILCFICLVIFFFYKMFTLFPDVYSDEENDKGGMYK